MRRALHAWLGGLLLVVIAICIAALSARFSFTADWSANARASITPQSQALLAVLQGPLTVTAYARPGTLRAKTRLLIQRYQRFKRDLTLRFVDPDLDPIATQHAGITVDGELELGWHGRRQFVKHLDQQDFAEALVRLARGGAKLVAFVTGNGERAAGGTGAADLGDFVDELSTRGVRALPLNLAEAAEVPRNADLVVLADPAAALLPASVQKLQDYVADGGNLLWLTGPGDDDLGLAPLAADLGIERLPGMLLEAAPSGVRDPRMIVTAHYPAQAITQGFHVNAVFPRTATLAVRTNAQWQVQPILESGQHSWNQTAPFQPALGVHPVPAPHADVLRGPLTFGYALSRMSASPGKHQQRVVVIGDTDFLTNAYLADAGNLPLGERVVNWLLGDDMLVDAPAAAPDAVLKPTHWELGVLTYGYLVGLPIALILAGLGIVWRRRRR